MTAPFTLNEVCEKYRPDPNNRDYCWCGWKRVAHAFIPAPTDRHKRVPCPEGCGRTARKGGHLCRQCASRRMSERFRARAYPRDSKIVARVRAGETYQDVADAVGLTRQRIYQIVEGWK